MNEWQVPGVAIGIIRDGEILVRQCFGYRDVERKLPVTPATQFAIGSCSKAFTAASVGTSPAAPTIAAITVSTTGSLTTSQSASTPYITSDVQPEAQSLARN